MGSPNGRGGRLWVGFLHLSGSGNAMFGARSHGKALGRNGGWWGKGRAMVGGGGCAHQWEQLGGGVAAALGASGRRWEVLGGTGWVGSKCCWGMSAGNGRLSLGSCWGPVGMGPGVRSCWRRCCMSTPVCTSLKNARQEWVGLLPRCLGVLSNGNYVACVTGWAGGASAARNRGGGGGCQGCGQWGTAFASETQEGVGCRWGWS